MNMSYQDELDNDHDSYEMTDRMVPLRSYDS